MFELSNNITINLEILDQSKIYIIDNFYRDPYSVLEYFLQEIPPFWKEGGDGSNNGLYFEDRRHHYSSEEIEKVYDALSFLCGRTAQNRQNILTNVSRFKKCSFNDYYNNYWWPHLDEGYTGLLYFNNDDEVSGTNLYECLDDDYVAKDEHKSPWISKDKFRLVKTLYPRFNRLVLFDANKFYHGMNVCNDVYFGDQYRMNQAFFFNPVDK